MIIYHQKQNTYQNQNTYIHIYKYMHKYTHMSPNKYINAHKYNFDTCKIQYSRIQTFKILTVRTYFAKILKFWSCSCVFFICNVKNYWTKHYWKKRSAKFDSHKSQYPKINELISSKIKILKVFANTQICTHLLSSYITENIQPYIHCILLEFRKRNHWNCVNHRHCVSKRIFFKMPQIQLLN